MIETILYTAGTALVSVFIGRKWSWAKIKRILKEAKDLVEVGVAAAEDGKLTAEEAKRIMKELKELLAAIKS